MRLHHTLLQHRLRLCRPLKDLYLHPRNSENYTKHGYGVSQGGYVSFKGFDGINTTVQFTIINNILRKALNKRIKPHKYNWQDGNNRNFRLDNMIYKGKSLTEWMSELNITLEDI